jgi:hypothetical protein
MAEHYSRLVFDQELHDSLLNSVMSEPAEFPRYTLINTIAKQQSQILLDESAEFF